MWDKAKMQVLLALLLGNISALGVNSLAWYLRKNDLALLMWMGIFGFTAFLYWVGISGSVLVMKHLSPLGLGTALSEAEVYRAANLLMTKEICRALAITGIGGLVQMRQIPAKWWKAFLALWGEIGISLILLIGFINSPLPASVHTESENAFWLAFIITASVLLPFGLMPRRLRRIVAPIGASLC